MNTKTAVIVLSAFVAGAGANVAVDALSNGVKVHSLEFIVASDGKVRRSAFGVGDPTRGVVRGVCNDGLDEQGKVVDAERQKRLVAEIAVASAECKFP